MNPISVKQILTLRYDTTLKPLLPKLSWKDFLEEKSSKNYQEIIETSIINSIKKTVYSEKKLSISLSSGIDSTLVASILRKTFPKISIESISVTFADSVDESPNAIKISEKLETNHHVLSIDNYLLELPKAISIIKRPFWDLHWYYIVKKSASLSKLLLSGDGGDELFGGYTFRYKKFLSLVSENSSTSEKIQAYLKCHERDWVDNQELIFNKKINFSWKEIYLILNPFFNNTLSPLRQVMLADYNGKLLYNWSPLYNELHKFFNIKHFAPILNNEMLPFALHIPNELKYDLQNNTGKILLRKILQKYDMEQFIINKKQGFSVNTINLWKSHGQYLCKYFLENARIIQDGWINQDWVKKYINKSDLEIKTVNKCLGLLAFEIWYRIFITNEMNPNEKLTV